MIGRHGAHGYLVDDVFKSADEFTKLFGCKPYRIDETFAGFSLVNSEGNVEFFLWQWEHLEKNLGPDVMKKVKYRAQQAIRYTSKEEVDNMYHILKAQNVTFISTPQVYSWNAYCVYYIDNSGHMWELFCWTKFPGSE